MLLSCLGVLRSTMGGVDGFDRLLGTVYCKQVVASKSFQQPLMCSLLLLCVGNCVAHYRLAQTRADLDEDAWPSLPTYIRHLRDSVSYENFLAQLAMELLETGGHVPDARPVAPPPATAAPQGAGAGIDDAAVDGMAATLGHITHSVRRRQWFMSREGSAFRSYLSPRHPHTVVAHTKRRFCVVCTKTVDGVCDGDARVERKSKRRRVGRLSRYRCITCQVHLCIVARGDSPTPCAQRWHSREVF